MIRDFVLQEIEKLVAESGGHLAFEKDRSVSMTLESEQHRPRVADLHYECVSRLFATILKLVNKRAREELGDKRSELERTLRHVERAAVPAGYRNHDGARLWDYDRRTLNTIIRFINTLERRQAARRGLPV